MTNDKALPIPWMKAELTLSPWLDFPESHSTVSRFHPICHGIFLGAWPRQGQPCLAGDL